ncbi:MAG: toprim domain-containing protein [Lachnospiraceae bacterium]
MNTAFLVMDTSVDCTPSAKATSGNIEGSDPKHSFHYLGGDNTLYVFEAPIDLLSYISLHPENWQEHNYVACCGTSSIPVLEMVRQLPSSGKCASVWTMTMPVMSPASA